MASKFFIMGGAILFRLSLILLYALSALSARHGTIRWKKALLPCACENSTFDCSSRGKLVVNYADRTVCSGNLTADGEYEVGAHTVLLMENALETLPRGFPAAILVNATRNRVRSLPPEGALSSRLRVLDLSHNRIASVGTQLRNLSALQMLDLRKNAEITHLRFLPEKCSLVRLLVSSNQINSLDGPLSGCAALKTLDLSRNHLVNISEHVFAALTALEELDLSDNPVEVMAPATFHGQGTLRSLSLAGLGVMEFPEGLFSSLEKLERLSLMDNRLPNLRPEWFTAMRGLRKLSVARNGMRQFPSAALATLPQLQELELSVNFFGDVPPHAFAAQPKLRSLHLDFMNASSVSADAFTGIPDLRDLSLYGNHLSELPSGLNAQLPGLHTVDLGANPWEAARLPLAQLSGVRVLFFGTCPLKSLGPRVLAETPSLVFVQFYGNGIHTVHEDAFQGVTTLEFLNIGNNNISELPRNVFRSLGTLKVLEMDDNLLRELPSLVELVLLKHLSVSGNRLTAIRASTFRGLRSLEELNVGRNLLTALPSELFLQLPALRLLVAVANNITELPALPAEADIPLKMEEMMLAGNCVSLLSDSALRSWLGDGSHERYLDVGGGPIMPSALAWLLQEPQVLVGGDAGHACGCGSVRRGAALLSVCVTSAACAAPGAQDASFAEALSAGDGPPPSGQRPQRC